MDAEVLLPPEDFPDPPAREFVAWAARTRGPVLDIGALFGLTTLAALHTEAYVVASDTDARPLERLVQEAERVGLGDKLKVRRGHFPTRLDFPSDTFSGILVSRVMHSFDTVTLQEATAKLFFWLRPAGKVFVTVDANDDDVAPEALDRIFRTQGFIVERAEYFGGPEGRDSVALIARKI